MGVVVNRVTKAYESSANTETYPVDKYPVADWIHDPDMTEVTQGGGDPDPGEFWPDRYWIITGDIITLQDSSARDTTDSDAAAKDLTNAHLDLTRAVDGSGEVGMDVRALLLAAIDVHALGVSTLQSAIDVYKQRLNDGDAD